MNNVHKCVSSCFWVDFLHGFADEEVVVMFWLVRPSLVGGVPSYGVFVDSGAVGRMPFEPPDWSFRRGPNPASGVCTITPDPVIRAGYLL